MAKRNRIWNCNRFCFYSQPLVLLSIHFRDRARNESDFCRCPMKHDESHKSKWCSQVVKSFDFNKRAEKKNAMRSIAQAFVIEFDGPSGTRWKLLKICFSLQKASRRRSEWNRKLLQLELLGYNLSLSACLADYHNNGNVAASIHAARQIHMGWDFLLLSAIKMFCFIFCFCFWLVDGKTPIKLAFPPIS